MPRPPAIAIEAFESVDALAPADLRACTAIYNASWGEWLVGHRPVSGEAFADEERFVHEPAIVRRVLARDDAGALVGFGSITWRGNEPEPGACVAEVHVAPAARHAGVGSALVRRLLVTARAAGRIGLTLEVAVDSQADELCAKAGLRADLVVDLNQTDPHEPPDELLESWVTTGEAAAGYSLVAYDGRCPAEDLEAFVEVRHVMNDAPRYEGEPEWRHTGDEIRAAEDACAAAHQDWWALGVRHDASGRLVGLTDLFLPVARPWIAFQGDTGVAPDHRGHRLGAWMKAVNHLRLRRERPAVEVVQTWNASANAPMLRINHALGYRAVQQFRAWYLPFD